MVKTRPTPFADASASPLAGWGLIGRVGFGLFLLALVLAPLIGGYPTGAAYQNDTALNALRGLVILAAICLLVSPPPPLLSPEEKVSPSKWTKFAGGAMWGAFGWTLLSLLVHSRFLTSPVLLFAMLPATLDFLVYALAFWTAAQLMQNRCLLPYFAWALTVCAGIAAVLLIREYGQFVQGGMKGQRAQAPFFSPNFAAGFFALCLPVVVAFFVAQKERLAVLGTGVVAALMIGALAATGSRAGIALAVLGVGVALVLALAGQKNGLRLFPWAKAGVLVLVFSVMAFGFRGPLTARVEGGASGQEHSGDFRKETVRGSVDMVRANPVFGTGPGTFPYRYAPYARVARTDLAHQSYVQTAAEQGIPALLFACAALAMTFGAGAMAWVAFRKGAISNHETDSVLPRLLLCGLFGGVLAGAGRSLFDSEWSLEGNGLPFWCLAGLLAGLAPTTIAAAEEKSKNVRVLSPLRLAGVALLFVPLIFCFLLLQTASVRDALAANRASRTAPTDIPSVWPPDPQLLYFEGQFEEAARVEPSGKRWYQLGLAFGREGGSENEKRAVEAFQKSVEADPTNLQTWRRLAESHEKAGDVACALTAWRQLISRHEGPIGQIRAIPELTETHPAFAYFALAQAAQEAGVNTDARALYEKAEGVVERYSHTTPIYQQMEVQAAQGQGIDLLSRRAELRTLYEQSVDALVGLAPNDGDKNNLMRRKTDTLARFDALLSPGGNDASANSPGEPR